MIGFDEAIALLERAVEPLATETVGLEQAAGRFLAETLRARTDAPRRAVSSMDGYAVVERTTPPQTWLDIVGESRAGADGAGSLAPGQAMRIFTGAPLPEGADCVVMQEYAERDGTRVRFRESFGPDRHVRLAGSDFREGDVLVPAGARLTDRAMIAAAAADVAEVQVARRPRVAIIATGDELAAPGLAFDTPGALPDSASYGVAALCEALGCDIVSRARGRDRLDELAGIADRALSEADCVVVTGGASVGDHDLARPMFAEHGLAEVFAGVSTKPGRPVWLGRARDRLVLGLPGNPTSAMVTARLFLRPLLAAMQGGPVAAELAFLPLPLAAALPETGSRETFYRAATGPAGLVPVDNQQSGAQLPLRAADWLVRRAAGSASCDTGEIVDALPF